MSAVVEVEGLAAGYAGVRVVRELDLVVHAGEVVALLGPNGAGKTTTLLTISSLLPAIEGRVRVLGRDVPGLRQAWTMSAMGLAHVPEDRSLFFDLTVAENLRLARRRGPIGDDDVLGFFPALEPLMGRRAGVLSGGEQQMLALARALLTQPKVLMVDEMSLGLAPVIVQRVLPILREVADTMGIAVLLVEQHVDMALAVADRGYVLTHGELSMQGPAAELAGHRELLQAAYLGDAALEGGG